MKKIKRIIFLDIDGVMNHSCSKLKTEYDFEKEAVKTLNELYKSCPYFIVISSSWKESYPLMFLQKLFKKNGIKADVIDKTNCYFSNANRIQTPISLEDLDNIETDIRYTRDYEIHDWIKRMNPKHYVVIDDFSFDLEQIKNHHLLTYNWGENPNHLGLRMFHLKTLKQIMKR